MRWRHYVPAAALSTVLLLIVTGCGSAGSVSRTEAPTHTERQVERALRSEVEAWKGTPHELGGTTREGIDCSAFVRHVYDDAFDVSLPRSTRQQVRSGTALSPKELRAGDLVLFKTGDKTHHVGFYLDGGQFAHVSSSRGVTVSNLHSDYWQDTFWAARRVLSFAPSSPDSSQAASSAQLSSPSVGW